MTASRRTPPRGRLLPPSCLARRRPTSGKSDDRQKRPRSMSEAAVFSDRLVALDEAQREEEPDEEPPIEEDEPDDCARDCDEDQDPVDGDGDRRCVGDACRGNLLAARHHSDKSKRSLRHYRRGGEGGVGTGLGRRSR